MATHFDAVIMKRRQNLVHKSASEWYALSAKNRQDLRKEQGIEPLSHGIAVPWEKSFIPANHTIKTRLFRSHTRVSQTLPHLTCTNHQAIARDSMHEEINRKTGNEVDTKMENEVKNGNSNEIIRQRKAGIGHEVDPEKETASTLIEAVPHPSPLDSRTVSRALHMSILNEELGDEPETNTDISRRESRFPFEIASMIESAHSCWTAQQAGELARFWAGQSDKISIPIRDLLELALQFTTTQNPGFYLRRITTGGDNRSPRFVLDGGAGGSQTFVEAEKRGNLLHLEAVGWTTTEFQTKVRHASSTINNFLQDTQRTLQDLAVIQQTLHIVVNSQTSTLASAPKKPLGVHQIAEQVSFQASVSSQNPPHSKNPDERHPQENPATEPTPEKNPVSGPAPGPGPASEPAGKTSLTAKISSPPERQTKKHHTTQENPPAKNLPPTESLPTNKNPENKNAASDSSALRHEQQRQNSGLSTVITAMQETADTTQKIEALQAFDQTSGKVSDTKTDAHIPTSPIPPTSPTPQTETPADTHAPDSCTTDESTTFDRDATLTKARRHQLEATKARRRAAKQHAAAITTEKHAKEQLQKAKKIEAAAKAARDQLEKTSE